MRQINLACCVDFFHRGFIVNRLAGGVKKEAGQDRAEQRRVIARLTLPFAPLAKFAVHTLSSASLRLCVKLSPPQTPAL